MADIVKTYKLDEIKKALSQLYRSNDWQDVVTEQRFIAVFMERHKNWIRGDKFLIHSGWYKNHLRDILLEYETLWNDPEMQQIL